MPYRSAELPLTLRELLVRRNVAIAIVAAMLGVVAGAVGDRLLRPDLPRIGLAGPIRFDGAVPVVRTDRETGGTIVACPVMVDPGAPRFGPHK